MILNMTDNDDEMGGNAGVIDGGLLRVTRDVNGEQ